ncbi:hypothetical protein SDC9_144265 [bioreactor metagenome]|uniref:Uncharacterized protein n=1 Tax=bioreactor metagenome TaxID=1076179 RepID=A0A645E8X2_9ZZZZ
MVCAFDLERGAQHRIRHMDSIRDDLETDGRIKDSSDSTWLSVVEGRHGIEQMGRMADSGFNPRQSLFISCPGMADGYGNILAGEIPDQWNGSGQFRCQCHQANKIRVLSGQVPEGFNRREQGMFPRLGSGSLRVDEGSFQVDSQDSGSVQRQRVFLDGTHSLTDIRRCLSHGGGEK